MHDAFINSVKEADFLRNGNAKGIMSLSKEDSSGLWDSVQDGMFNSSSPPFILGRRFASGDEKQLRISTSEPVLFPTHLQHSSPSSLSTFPQHPHSTLPSAST